MTGGAETERVRRTYDRIAGRYERIMRRLERHLSERRRRLVADLTGDVLEIGIGTGATLPHYRQHARLTGVDISPRMLDLARLRAAEERVDVDLRVMDASHLEWADASFDAVIFTLTLCTIPDALAALREAVRVARPGSPIRYLEHVRSNRLPIALGQDALNPVFMRLHRDHVNRRTADIARAAGVAGLVERRGRFGIFSVGMGHAPGAVQPGSGMR